MTYVSSSHGGCQQLHATHSTHGRRRLCRRRRGARFECSAIRQDTQPQAGEQDAGRACTFSLERAPLPQPPPTLHVTDSREAHGPTCAVAHHAGSAVLPHCKRSEQVLKLLPARASHPLVNPFSLSVVLNICYEKDNVNMVPAVRLSFTAAASCHPPPPFLQPAGSGCWRCSPFNIVPG